LNICLNLAVLDYPQPKTLKVLLQTPRSLSEAYKRQRSDAVIFVGGKIFLFFEILFGRYNLEKLCVFSVNFIFPSKKLPLSRNKEEEES